MEFRRVLFRSFGRDEKIGGVTPRSSPRRSRASGWLRDPRSDGRPQSAEITNNRLDGGVYFVVIPGKRSEIRHPPRRSRCCPSGEEVTRRRNRRTLPGHELGGTRRMLAGARK